MLLWVGAIMGMFVNGLNGGIGAIISEAYPTVARATAQNTLWNLGRAVGSVGPLAVGALATKYSFHAAIGLLALIYLGYRRDSILDPRIQGKGARVVNDGGGTAIHIAIHNLAHGVSQLLAVRWLRPLSAGCLQTEDLGSYMNQFTAERYH
jgi:MFS family permease